MTAADTISTAVCFPFPHCPDRESCSRSRTDDGRLMPSQIAMNAMPYRVAGQSCGWFVARVDEVA